jgi:methyl-accepting chemotaxis protein
LGKEGNNLASKTINTILNLKDNFSKTIEKTGSNTKKFQRHLKQAENQAKRMREITSKGFMAIGATAIAAGAGMMALVNKTAESMDAIDKMSERTGITRERLQELKYAAGQTGVEFQSIEDGMSNLTKNMGKAGEGSKKIASAFNKLKINVKDSNGHMRSSTDLFNESIAKLADMKDQTQRNILGQKLFGGSWQEMIPLINQGSAGIKALTDRSRQLGLVVSEDAVKANVVFGDTLADIKDSFAALGTKLSNALLPYMQKFSDFLLVQIPKVEPIARDVFGKMANAVNAIRESMDWLIPVASGLLGTFMAFQIITKITAAMAAYKKITQTMTIVQWLLNASMLANPLTWVAIAIGVLIGLGVLLYKNWDVIKVKAFALWEGVKAAFAPIGQFFSGIFSGVKEGFRGFINFIIGGINKFTSKLSWIPEKLSTVPGFGWAANFVIPQIPSFALGTQYFTGGIARINEKGGEIVDLPNGSKVIPADKSQKMISGGGFTVNVNISGNVIGNDAFADELGEIIVGKVKLAMANM